MKAITVAQPFAWAILEGHKRVENRTRAPPQSLLGERIAIHAGKRRDQNAYNFVCKTLARAMDGPSPYKAPNRAANISPVPAISRRA